MACNHMFGAGEDLISPPNPNRYWRLDRADVAVFNRDKYDLMNDLEMLYGIANKLGDGNHIGMQAMFAANEMINLIRQGQESQAPAVAANFFSERTGSKAHQIYAMGHCHIDTAWLWPYDETIRKCARSFSAQLRLLEEYEDFTFVCSSAQQYAWVKQWYPGLFEEMKTAIANGRFIPVGGTWVENDGYVPSGESFIRQFFYGQRFFRQEFGVTCREFWLPDTFGYSAQIPQMIKHCGIDRFLTQKLSWNKVNKFPNHTFLWEGIDGTQVLTHFPPGDGYGMQNTADDFVNTQNNSLDKGRTNAAIVLFGNGDGGGGPTRTMIERLNRVKDTDGLPRVQMSSSNALFDRLDEDRDKLYKWVGELYLELHNGTYTSQAKIKAYNRKCEFLLREVELLMAIAYASAKVTEAQKTTDMATVDTAWQNVLLNQFHDVLPGSCIEFAAIDAWRIYEDVITSLNALRTAYHTRIIATGTARALYNPLPWEVKTVVFMRPDTLAPPTGANIQTVTLDATAFEDQTQGRFRVPNTFSAALVTLRPSGYTLLAPQAPSTAVTYQANSPGTGFGTYRNGIISLEVATTGRPYEKLFLNGKAIYNDYLGKNVEPAMFYIYDDIPDYWDAWDIADYHLETRRVPDFSNETAMTQISTGPIVGCYKWSANFGNGSSMVRYTIMRADSPMIEYYTIIDWKEDRKLLKVEFPMDILTREATYDIQYGFIARPTHINTSWDMAKYEVCGHKWVDVSQADKGVTIITDCKYGFHARDNVVQVSLLKSPKNPDGNCDMHKHFIYYAVLPHEGTFQEAEVIRRAYELNLLGSNNVPLLATNLTGATLPASWVTSTSTAVVVEAVKVCDAITRTIVVRLYESKGGSADTTVNLGFTITAVRECNGLEDPGDPVTRTGNSFQASFKPFQVRSFLVTF
ncbi:unnamed protein product [Orchesella dallaii]|uniref:alpha-mannosidase n=1 Tax=Orchesella dallaii TaxID=48710 RepID=A0ABP1RIS5_9HEXA